MYLFLLFFTFVFFYEQGFLLGNLKLGYHPKDQDEIRKHKCKKKVFINNLLVTNFRK